MLKLLLSIALIFAASSALFFYLYEYQLVDRVARQNIATEAMKVLMQRTRHRHCRRIHHLDAERKKQRKGTENT